jgi:hypothetical protein
MKHRLLRLQICDQRLDPVNCKLVTNSQKQFLVMLDLFVELSALVAHWEPVRAGAIRWESAYLVRRGNRKFVHPVPTPQLRNLARVSVARWSGSSRLSYSWMTPTGGAVTADTSGGPTLNSRFEAKTKCQNY